MTQDMKVGCSKTDEEYARYCLQMCIQHLQEANRILESNEVAIGEGAYVREALYELDKGMRKLQDVYLGEGERL